MSVTEITSCRICQSSQLTNVINLGEQYITSRFPIYGDWSTLKTPIIICKCDQCHLVQLRQTTFNKELYEYEYGYRSGISNTMRHHLQNYQKEILNIAKPLATDTVIDIGSNDSTMLQLYPSTMNRIGVDPTGKQFAHYYGDVSLIPTYFTRENVISIYPKLKAKIISSISMFYDLPDPVQFAKDIYSLLEDDGIWTCEQSYLPSMLTTNSIDTICHEHLEYYALYQIKEIADRANFKIINVSFNDCNGGSFRVYFAKRECNLYTECTNQIRAILKNEIDIGIQTLELYEKFITDCNYQISKLKDFIQNSGKKILIYGASTKGNCLLQYANIGEKDIQYAVERNLSKVGKMTSTGIKIISEETMRQDYPDYLLVLPWHFKDEIIKRENDFLEKGGQIIFPFPEFQIISLKPKVLITGIDGMIGNYVVSELQPDYTIYGFGHTPKQTKNTTFYFNMKDIVTLEKRIDMIRPDIIIHLAGISSSSFAFNNPVETCIVNGLLTAHLCEIIHKNKWNMKLFNASSSEIYKGHINYTVKEDDHNMFHLHPYSIAKTMGHNMIEFYRNIYNLPFSNGVLFTIESPQQRPEFLLNKVTQHAKNWISGNKTPLKLGSLDSYRNILHAKDAASALKCIIKQSVGDTYLISSNESKSVYDLVLKIYDLHGIQLIKNENMYYCGNDIVFTVENVQKGFDIVATNITGYAEKLANLGWKQTIYY